MICFFAALSRFRGQSSSRTWCCLWKTYGMQSKRPHKRGRCTNSNSTCRTTCLVISSESCNDHILLLWEVSRQVTMVANFLEVSWPRRPPLHCRTHGKFISVKFFSFFFLPYLQDHGLLRSRHFATMANMAGIVKKVYSYRTIIIQ